jgi:hypothetical protein
MPADADKATMRVGPNVCLCDHNWLDDTAVVLPEVVDYAPGTERDFTAVAAIVNGNDEAAVQQASEEAQRKQDEWGRQCPDDARAAAFTWRSGYELYEVIGEGWFVRFTQSIRLYTLEESTTLPGDWSPTGDGEGGA